MYFKVGNIFLICKYGLYIMSVHAFSVLYGMKLIVETDVKILFTLTSFCKISLINNFEYKK